MKKFFFVIPNPDRSRGKLREESLWVWRQEQEGFLTRRSGFGMTAFFLGFFHSGVSGGTVE